jgi:hypothetical protein
MDAFPGAGANVTLRSRNTGRNITKINPITEQVHTTVHYFRVLCSYVAVDD